MNTEKQTTNISKINAEIVHHTMIANYMIILLQIVCIYLEDYDQALVTHLDSATNKHIIYNIALLQGTFAPRILEYLKHFHQLLVKISRCNFQLGYVPSTSINIVCPAMQVKDIATARCLIKNGTRIHGLALCCH